MIRLWPLVGLPLFAMPVGLGAWLFFQVPLLGNPAFVMQGIKNGTIEFSSLSLMAAMLPVLVLACLASLLCAVACLFAVFAGERKYLKIIGKLTQG